MTTCLPVWVSSALFYLVDFYNSGQLLDVLSSHALQAVPLSLHLPHSYSFNLSHHPSEFHFLSPKLFLANLWP